MPLNEYDWGYKDGREGQAEYAWREHWSEDYARGVKDGVEARATVRV